MAADHFAAVTTAAAKSDSLHRALAESGDSRCWLVIDPTIRPLDANEPLAQALSEAGTEIVHACSPHPGVDASVMPCLAHLDSERPAGSAALRLSIEEALAELEPAALTRGAARRIGGWLQSSASGAVLAEHISRQMVQRRRDGRLTLLRWTDPAVLWAMWSTTLLKQQQSVLLGPISAFYLLDPAGNQFTLGASSVTGIREVAFTDEQWQQLDAIGPLNQALLQFGAAGLGGAAMTSARDTGMAAVLRARLLGFAEKGDLAAFAWRAMFVHPQFDDHPLVTEKMRERQPDDLFSGLVDCLDENQWALIAKGVREPEPR